MKEELEIMRSKVKYKVIFSLLKVIRKILGHDYRVCYTKDFIEDPREC